MSRAIDCHACGKWCGWHHPAHITADPYYSYPAEEEGPGEDYQDKDGNWHCSDKCLADTEAKNAPSCDNCGERPAPHQREEWDSAPTDRGDRTTYYTTHYCDECWQETGII